MADLFDIREHSGECGTLNVIEFGEELPFLVERVYYLHSVPEGCSRGHHAHKKLKQFFVCISGSVTLYLHNGEVGELIELSSRSRGLLVEYPAWRELRSFKEDTVLMVFASDAYDENDYITTFEEFIDYVKAV